MQRFCPGESQATRIKNPHLCLRGTDCIWNREWEILSEGIVENNGDFGQEQWGGGHLELHDTSGNKQNGRGLIEPGKEITKKSAPQITVSPGHQEVCI